MESQKAVSCHFSFSNNTVKLRRGFPVLHFIVQELCFSKATLLITLFHFFINSHNLIIFSVINSTMDTIQSFFLGLQTHFNLKKYESV